MPKTRIVKFADRDELDSKLKECMEYNRKHSSKKISFSQFLARTTLKDRLKGKTDNDLVIADLSDLQVQVRDLKGLDFGEVILNGTTFSGCDLSNARIASNAGMENLKFENQCSLAQASIEGDVGGVIIGGGTNISELDLTKASGFAKCRIDEKSVKGTGIKIPFANIDAFAQYLANIPKDPDLSNYQTTEEASQKAEKEFISLADFAAKGRDAGIRGAEAALDAGMQAGEVAAQGLVAGAQAVGEAVYSPNIPTSPGAAWNMVIGGASWGLGALASGAVAVGKKVFRGDTPTNPLSPSTKPFLETAPMQEEAPEQIFTCSVEGVDLAATEPLTLKDLKAWQQQKSSQTLESYAKSKGRSPVIRNVNIENINFEDKIFGDVTFAACSFKDCNFKKCNLEKTSLLDCGLENTNFREIIANGMECKRSSFNGCKIEKSNLDRADFTETKFEKTKIINTRLQNANLHRTYYKDTEIEKSYLDNAKMDYAIGQNLTLKEVAANHIDLTSSKLLATTMDKVDLTGATAHKLAMPKSTITHSKLNEMDADAMNLQQSTIANVEIKDSNLAFADLSGSDISSLLVKGSNLTKARLANIQGIKQSSFETITAPGIDLQGSTIATDTKFLECSMQHAEMQGAIVKGKVSKSDLTGGNLENTQIENAIIEDSHLKEVNLKGAKIHGGSLERSNLSGADLEKTEIGIEGKLTSVKDMVVDQTTKMLDTKLASGSDRVTHIDLDRKKSQKSLDDIKAESSKEQDINNASLPRKWLRAAINTTAGILKLGGDGAESVGSSITKRRSSKMGAVLGGIVGVAAGAALVAATA